jgi:hypothetical protein
MDAGSARTRDFHTPASVSPRLAPVLRLSWIAVAVLVVGVWIAASSAQWRVYTARGAELQQALDRIGVSVDIYAASQIGIVLLTTGAFLLVGAILAWRAGQERVALFVAFLFLGIAGAPSNAVIALMPPPWQQCADLLGNLGWISIWILGYIFPDGRFVPRWSRWLVAAYVALFAADFVIDGLLDSLLGFAAFLAVAVGALVAQIYRYRRISDYAQRQQTKWVVAGLVAALPITLAANLLVVLMPSLDQPGALYPLLRDAITVPALLLIPLSLLISILRSRLWDIDVIINRTLTYGLLTAFLAFAYFSGVGMLQWLFRAITGQGSTVSVVAATLAVAALFQPLRRRIQALIDRHFYRRKYDAARTLAAFGATLRDETDLERLSAHLVAAVEETMQPTHVSLWLRPRAEGRRR